MIDTEPVAVAATTTTTTTTTSSTEKVVTSVSDDNNEQNDSVVNSVVLSAMPSLRVNDRSLNAETELRRLFGNATVDEAIAERTASRMHPNDPRLRSQRPSLASVRSRIYCMVTVRAEWPKSMRTSR
jgi:hypothetical protein